MTQALDLFNRFILAHNVSRESEVIVIRMRDYMVAYDPRTHPLTIFTSGTGGDMQLDSRWEAIRKLLRLIRKKYVEATDPLLPIMFRTREQFSIFPSLLANNRVEERRGFITIRDNIPYYTLYPLWNFKDNPLLTLLIRIPLIHALLARDPIYAACLAEGISPGTDNVLEYIERTYGQMIIQMTIGNRVYEKTSIDRLMPKYVGSTVSSIGFKDFDIATNRMEIFSSETGSPTSPYLIRQGETHIPGYRLMTWINQQGYLQELIKDIQTIIKPDGTNQLVGSFSPASDALPVLSLHTREECKLVDDDICGTFIKVNYRENGEYTAVSRSVQQHLFRLPVMCDDKKIEDITDFPIYVQRKLDGNRIIVYYLENGREIVYYTKVGFKQSDKFPKRFNRDIMTYCLEKGIKNMMLDCECYNHNVIHQDIGGWCNKKESCPEFEQLYLYVLSFVDLDRITEFIERKEKRTMVDMTYREFFETIRGDPDEEEDLDTVIVNDTLTAHNQEDLREMMRDSVSNGYEGLVLYPANQKPIFGMRRLFKIKKFYDGEVTVIGFKESVEEPGTIGSIQVSAQPYLGIPCLMKEHSIDPSSRIIYYISACLKGELKPGSWNNPTFSGCIGKQYTIECGSFSDTGVPIHGRFKNSFSPSSFRHEEDI
jgi:hypothetical protein